MNKLEKIERQEQKTREKIAAMQAILKQIDGARTEQENLQIIQQVRALKLSREELYAFINGGNIPATLAGAIGGADTTAAAPETIYSRRDRKRRNADNAEPTATEQGETTPKTDTRYGETTETENTNYESEGMNNEE